MARYVGFFSQYNYSKLRKINKNNEIVFKTIWILIQPADGKWCSVKKDNKAEDLTCTMQIFYELKTQTTFFLTYPIIEYTVPLLLWEEKRQYLMHPDNLKDKMLKM